MVELIFFQAIVLIALPLVIQYLISPRQNKGGEKLIPYECGEVPQGSAWVKFNIRFYIIALIFIIFDVEVIFMYPWALAYKEFGIIGFIEMLLFVSILLVGLFYVWRKGDLDWVKMEIRNPKGRYKDTRFWSNGIPRFLNHSMQIHAMHHMYPNINHFDEPMAIEALKPFMLEREMPNTKNLPKKVRLNSLIKLDL